MLSLERCVSVYKCVNRVISETLLKMRQFLLRSASIQSRSGLRRCAHTYIPIPSLFAPPLPSLPLPPAHTPSTPAHAKRAGAPLRGHHVPAHNRLEVRRVVQLPVAAQTLLLAVTNGDRSMVYVQRYFRGSCSALSTPIFCNLESRPVQRPIW